MIDIFLGGILKKQVGFYYWGISLTKSIGDLAGAACPR